MCRVCVASLVVFLAASSGSKADDPKADVVLDKAIGAMGGAERLSRFATFSAKGRGVFVMDGADLPFTFDTTVNGLGQFRTSFDVDANGTIYSAATVIDGENGWRKILLTQKLVGNDLAEEKHNSYLQLAPLLLTSLRGDAYQRELVGDDEVEGRPTTVVRLTGPNGKDFTAHFDRQTGLMVKLAARVLGWERQAYAQEIFFEEYKEFDGVKAATRTRSLRDGQRYAELEGVEFRALDGVKPGTFSPPR